MIIEKMKRLYGLFIIMTSIIVLAVILAPFLAVEAAGDARTAYGYQVTVWKYNGSGNPEQVGKPILIYHPDLMGDIFVHKSVEIPTSFEALMSRNWGLTQIIDKDADNTWKEHDNGTNPDSWSIEGFFSNPNNPSGEVVFEDMFGNEYVMDNMYFYTYDLSDVDPNFKSQLSACYDPGYIDERKSGRTGYQKYIISYASKDRKITYRGSDITGLGKYYARYSDSNLTANNINNNGYLDKIIKGKYFKNVQSIKTYFGIDINYADIDKYYVSVEPVLRVLDGLKKYTETYLLTTFDRTYTEKDGYKREEITWGKTGTSSLYHKVWTKTSSYNCGRTYDCNCRNVSNTSCKNISGYGSQRRCENAGYNWKNGACRKCTTTTTRECDTCYRGSTYEVSGLKQGVKNIYYIYGRKADHYSHLETARSAGASSYYLNRAVNYCDNIDNKHCELEDDMVTCKKDSNGNIIYQYYVGPNLEKALVGTTSKNYYLLSGSCSNGVSGRNSSGIKHYYLEDLISCKDTCKVISDKSSDEYLKCAENYCDAEVDYELKGNARIRKKNCIIKSCGYTYGTVPEGGKNPDDLESKNSCNNANPYKGKEKLLLGSNSDCNVNTSTSKLMQNEKAVTVSCNGDAVTDFDNNDTNDTIFDQRTYINTACMEETSFEYEDLKTEETELKPGSPINYYVNQTGVRKCTYFFNLEQWKFDYATIPSKDKDRRKRLKYIYTTFNHAYDESYDPKTNGAVYDKDFEDANDGKIDVQKYDIEKTQVISKVKEIVENKIKTSSSELLVRQDEKENTVYNSTKEETIKMIENMKETTTKVGRYESISTAVATYRYNKKCLTTDGEAKVYTPEGDVCHTLKNGEEKLAKYAYYTDMKATYDKDFAKSDYEHRIYTTATVGVESASGNLYYSNNESCKYTLDKQEEGPGCVIKIIEESGTDLLGNNVYEGGAVKAKVVVLNEEGLEKTDRIQNITLNINGETTTGEEKLVDIKNKGNSREDFKIVGTVTTKNGLVSRCEKEIIILKHSGCVARCNINKLNEKLYEIVGAVTNTVYKSTIINMEKTSVAKTIDDKKYYVTVPEEIKENDMVIGYVGGEGCNEYCYNPLEKPEGQSCTSIYKPSEIGNITAYCNADYRTDLNNYKSVDECISQCSNACPNECREESDLKDYCKNNATSLGFESINECLNRCYCPYAEDGYLFRSIHNYDPFPYSPNSPYVKGNRGIGKNWYAKEEIITNDSQDTSSVTGDNANRQVEYIMELQIDDIRKIRNENDKEGRESYTKLIYSSQTEDEDYVGEYKSKLLHDTLVGDGIFINSMNDVSAKYMPGQDN